MSKIDWSRLRSITARQINNALQRGNQSGSHQRYQHSDSRRVTVSFHHPGEAFRPKTLRSIVEVQARWSEDDLRRVRLIK